MTQQMDDLMLPEPDTVILAYSGCSSEYIDGYERGFDDALDKMREYAKKAVEAERERLLDILKEMHMKTNGSHNYYLHAAVHLRKQLTR